MIYCVYSPLKLGGCPWRLGTSCFPLDREPTMEDIAGYIDHPLWDAFTAFIDESYGAKTAHRVQPVRRRSGLET